MEKFKLQTNADPEREQARTRETIPTAYRPDLRTSDSKWSIFKPVILHRYSCWVWAGQRPPDIREFLNMSSGNHWDDPKTEVSSLAFSVRATTVTATAARMACRDARRTTTRRMPVRKQPTRFV